MIRKENRIREYDWTPATRDSECHECQGEVREGDPVIRVSYRGVPRNMCQTCAMSQIGGAPPPEDMR